MTETEYEYHQYLHDGEGPELVEEPARLPDLIPGQVLRSPEEVRRGITAYIAALTERLYHEVQEARRERDERLGDLDLGRTDVAPLIRSLAGVADALDYGATNLRQVAKIAREVIGEEVRATGETKIVTPDGLGQEVVAKVSAPRSRVVDVDALLAALSAVRRTEAGRIHGHEQAEVYMAGYQQAQEDVLATGKVVPSVTKVDALSRALQAAGQDDLAGGLDRTLRWETGEEKVTVTVEDPKRTRR